MIELKINNFNYKLYFVKENDERLLMEDKEYHSGVTDFKNKEIYINRKLNIDALKYTVKHELTHAIIDSYRIIANRME